MSAELENELGALALGIIREAKDKSLDLRIDALKAVTTLHLGLAKINGKVGDDAPSDTGLPAFRKRIEEASQGGK